VPFANHTHLAVKLDAGGSELRFRDIRRFGTAMVFPTPAGVEEFFESSGLGPEPFGLPAAYWREQLTGVEVLHLPLDHPQSSVSGGNVSLTKPIPSSP